MEKSTQITTEETGSIRVQVQRIYKMQSEGPLKAFAEITINDALLIKGLKVLEGKGGLFVTMPCEKAKDNKWYESVRALTKSIENEITQKVLEAYNDN